MFEKPSALCRSKDQFLVKLHREASKPEILYVSKSAKNETISIKKYSTLIEDAQNTVVIVDSFLLQV